MDGETRDETHVEQHGDGDVNVGQAGETEEVPAPAETPAETPAEGDAPEQGDEPTQDPEGQ